MHKLILNSVLWGTLTHSVSNIFFITSAACTVSAAQLMVVLFSAVFSTPSACWLISVLYTVFPSGIFYMFMCCETGWLQTTSPLQWGKSCCSSWQSVLWPPSFLEWVTTFLYFYTSVFCHVFTLCRYQEPVGPTFCDLLNLWFRFSVVKLQKKKRLMT